jgi:arylsulfatase A-like enzyme
VSAAGRGDPAGSTSAPNAAAVPSGRRGRRLAWAVAVLALVLGLLALDRQATGARSVEHAARLSLVELGRLAGVRDAQGRATGTTIAVDVAQSGGELWIGQAIAAAVDRDPAFERGDGPHVLTVEVVENGPAIAMRMGLWRRGWSLGPPRPAIVRTAPFIVLLALAIGALVRSRGRSVGASLAIAGGLAQAGTLLLPWPGPGVPPGLVGQWRDGPLATVLRLVAERLPDSATAIGAGVIALCLVLAVFDHRRSPGRGGGLVISGLLGAAGVVALVEAAVRVGVPGALGQVAGWIAVLAVVGLWWIARSPRTQLAALALPLMLLSSACESDAPPTAASPPPAPEAPSVVAPVSRVESTEGWLDLVAQRPSAVALHEDRVVVDLSSKTALKHFALPTAEAWTEPTTVDGRQAAVLRGKSGEIDVPLDGDLAPVLHPDVDGHPGLALAVTVNPLVESQSMTVLLDERPLAHLALPAGWQRRTFSLPADALHAGDNRVRLHFRRIGTHEGKSASAAVARVEIGPHDAIVKGKDEPEDDAYRVHLRPGGEPELWVPAGRGLAWYLVPPRRGRLVIDARGHGAIEVRVSSDADHREGRPPTALLDDPLRPAGDRRELDLTAWGEVPVRVEVRVRGSGEDAGATIRVLEVLARRTVARDERDRAPRDVIVVGIEGARADAMLDPGRQPTLDVFEGFVRESLVFERAYSTASVAVPSHAAWLSSVPPPVHLTVSGTYVADGQTLLPEALGRAGYFRALLTANGHVSAERGLQQGFDLVEVIDGETEDHDARALMRRSEEVVRRRSERRFVYTVVNDPQASYEPPRDVLEPVTPPLEAPLQHLTELWVTRVQLGKRIPSKDELAYVRRLYRGELRVIDAGLGELLEALRAEDRLDDAIVVVMSLHGEEFFEHGGAGHGKTLFEESIRVPLAIRAPKLLAPGRVSAPVDLLDLGPTLLDLVGAHVPDSWQGESLVPIIDDPQPPPRLVSAYHGDGSEAGIVGTHKLVVGPGRSERLYDLGADPGETEDRRATAGIPLRIVRTALAWSRGYDGWKRARWGTGADLEPAFALDQGM